MRKNIVVLLLDTVRASDVQGNSELKTLNYIHRNATSYECAISPGTWTVPTHAALFTNKRVSKIKKVSRNFLSNGTYKIDPWMVKTKFLDKDENTIARRLSLYGYQSVLLSNNPFLTSSTNLAAGFDKIQDIWLESNVKYGKSLASKFNFILNGGTSARIKMMKLGYLATKPLPKSVMDKVYLGLRRSMTKTAANVDGTHRLDRGADDTNKLLNKHLTYNYNYKPQFMFINYMEAHENYPVNNIKVPQDKWLYLSGIEELSDYNISRLHRGYIRRLRYLDKSINRTMEILKAKGVLENATVIFTSDHGQFFGEHNLLYHSLPPYEGVSRVPLLAANYQNGKLVKAKDTVETPVSISALHDSILNLASGKFDYLDGNLRKDRYILCEHTGIAEGWDEKLLRMLAPRAQSARRLLHAKMRYNKKVTAVYNKNLKLMHHFGKRKDEMYDIIKDPTESTNIIDKNRQLAHDMIKAIYN
jgi:arylsulfatase A-like enzyme